MNFIKTLKRDKQLRKKFCITLSILLLCRILAAIPTPGINTNYFKAMMELNGSFGLLNIITGNGLDSLSLMTLSIAPYITASIIIQLLGIIFKRIQELQNGMKDERQKIEYITLSLGCVMAFIEAVMMAWGYGAQGLLKDYTWYWVFIVAAIWTLFAVLASIAGKFITDKGIGNGISLILLTNILVSYPNDVMTLLSRFVLGKKVTTAIVALIFIITGTVALFAFTYVLQDSQKNIPVNYSAKISGSGVNKRVSSIPLKLCPGGVVPIIFATSIMTTPVMIASVFGKNDNIILNILNSAYWFQPEQMVYSVGVIIYIALIFGFSYFYTGITINPADIAEKIKKAGGNISGIRPGKSTVEYIKKQTKHMTAIGAAALVLIALIPIILGGIYGLTRISFLGTSIIITVGVILDTRKVIQTEMQQGVYIEQMKKGGLFHA